ncbi:MAG: ATP-binding protein [Acidobacteriota bacterium]
MAEILDERADSIRLEPPGPEGEGVEFWLRKGDIKEYHQVKRQHGSRNHWSISALGQAGVLQTFLRKLSDEKTLCVFVSTNSTELDELSDRATRAASFAEFEREFAPSKQDELNQLRQNLGLPSLEAVYHYLQKIRVETISENTLITVVKSRLSPLVEGDPANVLAILAQFALDKVHHELTAFDLWQHLESRGYRRRQWGKDPHVLSAVDEANNRYLFNLRQEAISGKMIPREEAHRAVGILTSSSGKRSVLLAGEAGVGKSSVIYEVIEALRNQGWPVVAFRVDRLTPTQLPDEVGKQLSLPGSPAHVLAAIAQGRDCALVIDQLDAVSLASGRHIQFFECINEIIKQAQAHSNIHLILACRKFDLDNDDRLKRLKDDQGVATVVAINRLSHSTVKSVVEEMRLEANRLTARQLDLLSVPLHLKLLADAAKDSSRDALDFQTANDLYDKFCLRKQAAIREAIGRSVQWKEVVGALCDYMNDKQVLYAPKLFVDEKVNLEDVGVMVSWHVLIEDGKQYVFFHESFFDYAFARRFVSSEQGLIDLLQNGEQHLFRRAQVRQILIYRREADRARYLDDIKALLASSEIRFHIKDTVLALMASVSDPTEEEWKIIAPYVEDSSNPLSQKVWRLLNNSVLWIHLIDSLGLIKRWLADGNEDLANWAVGLLAQAQQYMPDRVAELIEPYIGAGDEWRNRFLYLTQRGGLESCRRFFDLFLKLIDEGGLDDWKGGRSVSEDFWSFLYSLSQKRPEWCCEAISHYLNRRLALSLACGQTNPFDRLSGSIPDTQFNNEILLSCAHGKPGEFIESVFPFMLSVIKQNTRMEGYPPWEDPIWSIRFSDESYSFAQSLLTATDMALRSLASNNPEEFAIIASRLRDTKFETIQYLLIRAYTANGVRFADEAADYLCELPIRFETGDANDSHSATRNLLAAITPFCTDEKLKRIEEIVLSYYTDWEKSADGRKGRGYRQFMLLSSIASSRLSDEAKKRLEEWRRKFRRQKPESSVGITGGFVPSPISQQAAEKMNDEQWLKAMARYNYDWDSANMEERLTGGAVELSRVLEIEVKKEPARFAELCLRIPDDANSYYFSAILRGIAESGLDTLAILNVCTRCHQLPNRPCGREICEAISKLTDCPLPDEAVTILAWYATEDPDPVRETWRKESPDETAYYGGDLLMAGLNSVRGGTAKAVGDLIFADADRASQLLLIIERLVCDPSIAVRSWVAYALTALLNYDRNIAVDLFRKLCETEDELFRTRTVEDFLHFALQTHYETLEPILNRMIESELPEAARIGARRVCLTALIREEVRPLALTCISGTDAQRIGAAEIFSANLHLERFRSFCSQALIRFFSDPNEEVRLKAANCFHRLDEKQLEEHVDLIDVFIDGPAFTKAAPDFIRTLGKATFRLADVTCRACEKFIDLAGSDTADFRTRGPLVSAEASKLLIRMYSQSSDTSLQSRCLDLIDRMIETGSYGLHEALDLYER